METYNEYYVFKIPKFRNKVPSPLVDVVDCCLCLYVYLVKVRHQEFPVFLIVVYVASRWHLNGIGWWVENAARNIANELPASRSLMFVATTCRACWLISVYASEHPSLTVASHKPAQYTNTNQPNRPSGSAQKRRGNISTVKSDPLNEMQWHSDSWATCSQQQTQQPSPSAVTESEAGDSQASFLVQKSEPPSL